jgi:protein-tyrosine-phosphatase
MAEAIMRKRWQEIVGTCIDVSSMGIHAYNKQPPMEFAAKVCAENNIYISNIFSRPIILDELNRSDLIFVMEPVQKEFLKTFFPHLDDIVFLLASFPKQSLLPKFTIHDPVTGTINDYRKTFNIIYKEIDRIIPILHEQYE